MPWVDEVACNGCGTCVEECPVDAIIMIDEKARIDMDNCIRCGICHDACPEDAVMHDSEKIPEEVASNVDKTQEFMKACVRLLGDEEEGQRCLSRMIKHFNKEKTVAEKTLAELRKLKKG
jgi:ferredoxin